MIMQCTYSVPLITDSSEMLMQHLLCLTFEKEQHLEGLYQIHKIMMEKSESLGSK